MIHTRIFKTLVSLALSLLVAAALVSPALAFSSRSGQEVVVPPGETVNDDLYVTASTFTLDGTINGDLIVFAQSITINGRVNGSLFAAGQTIVINGSVMYSARLAGQAIQLGTSGSLGRDLVAAGASLETRPGSMIHRDLVFAGAQALLGGQVDGNAQVAANGLEIQGGVARNVTAELGSAGNSGSPSTMPFFSNTGIPIPSVPPGLILDPSAHIGGDLHYTSAKAQTVPEGVVGGQTVHSALSTSASAPARIPSLSARVFGWFLNLLRSLVVLFLLGLLGFWLVPKFLKDASGELQSGPWWSLLWGVLSYPVLLVVVLTILIILILLAVLFGFLTLWPLIGLVVAFGLLALFAVILGFVLAAGYLVNIVLGDLLGKLILNAIQPDLGKHRIGRLLLGIFIVAVLVSLPWIGWLFGLAVLFFGLGAIWMVLYRRLARSG